MAKPKSRDAAIARVKKRIIPVSQADSFAKVLLFGRNKQGKTRIAATAPKPALLIDVNERGTKSIRSYPDVDVFPAKDFDDVVYAYWYLRGGEHEYQSVILDTVTQFQNVTMAKVLQIAEDRDPNRPPKTPSQREWGAIGERLVPQILNYRNLPMHVIFVAQERNAKDRNDEDAEDYIVPDMSPKPRGALTAGVDVMGYVYQKEVRGTDKKKKKETSKWETRMIVGPHDNYLTGNRLNLPRVIRKPTIPQIIEALNSKED